MTAWTDPGEQEHGRAKRRGIPQAKSIDQVDAFSDVPPPPANSGPATRRGDPETSRAAARRAAGGITSKQLAILTCFQLWGAMTDEELVERYEGLRREVRGMPDAADLIPEQSPSGIRSRRAELTALTLGYIVPTGFKRAMKTGGEGNVHRLKDPSVSLGLNAAQKVHRFRAGS